MKIPMPDSRSLNTRVLTVQDCEAGIAEARQNRKWIAMLALVTVFAFTMICRQEMAVMNFVVMALLTVCMVLHFRAIAKATRAIAFFTAEKGKATARLSGDN